MGGIVDVSAWTGTWSSQGVRAAASVVRRDLKDAGIDRIFMASLDGVWSPNPHLANVDVYEAAERWEDVFPVPVIDPTIATWEAEVERARAHPGVRLVKCMPSYTPFPLDDSAPLAEALIEADLGLIVQIRVEDPRRQHPLAQVPDVSIQEVVELAQRHADLTVIAAGAAWSATNGIAETLVETANLYADVSQADGMGSLKLFVERGLQDKLLFGTHAPLFIPRAAIARVVADLDDGPAGAILGGNAEALLGLD